MPVQAPPPPIEQAAPAKPGAEAPIMDMRDQFKRTTPQSAEDKARTKEFIDGKIEMIRRDPAMNDAEKAAAIAELEAKR